MAELHTYFKGSIVNNIDEKIRDIQDRGITVHQFGLAWTLQCGQRHMRVVDLSALQHCDLDY